MDKLAETLMPANLEALRGIFHATVVEVPPHVQLPCMTVTRCRNEYTMLGTERWISGLHGIVVHAHVFARPPTPPPLPPLFW